MKQSNGYLSLSIIALIVAIAYYIAIPQLVSNFKQVFGYVEIANCHTDSECENAEANINNLEK